MEAPEARFPYFISCFMHKMIKRYCTSHVRLNVALYNRTSLNSFSYSIFDCSQKDKSFSTVPFVVLLLHGHVQVTNQNSSGLKVLLC